MKFKERYLITKKNGLLDRFRGDEISKLIAEEKPQNAQIALLMNTVMQLIEAVTQLMAGEPDLAEWNAYQAYRARVKEEVDRKLAACDKECSG